MKRFHFLALVIVTMGLTASGCVFSTSDSCIFSLDGECDDGSYDGAFTEGCDRGTDETDFNATCETTCRYDGDGVCDDGGEGSVSAVCSLGTDCSDCGSRE